MNNQKSKTLSTIENQLTIFRNCRLVFDTFFTKYKFTIIITSFSLLDNKKQLVVFKNHSTDNVSMQIINDISHILRQAQQNAYHSINQVMVQAYWLVGRRIVEEEQQGEAKAAYGKGVIKSLSQALQKEFGRGFSVDNLENMRRFYIAYPNSETLSRNLDMPDFQLSWSHYQILLRIGNKEERTFYEIEAVKNNWSLRELKRQFDSTLYLRLALSKDKEGIKRLGQMGQVIEKPQDAIKDPYILELLAIKEQPRYSENDFENALIDKLEHFLLELGKGFTFVARQKRISFDERHFYIDLVFYNRFLRCLCWLI